MSDMPTQAASNSGANIASGTPSITPSETQGPEQPKEPTPEENFKQWTKDVADAIKLLQAKQVELEGNQGKIVSLLESFKPAVTGQQNSTGGQSGFSLQAASQFAKELGLNFGSNGDPLADVKMRLGDTLLNKTLDSVITKVMKEISGETAAHVVH
jgi:hypothetical protein